MTVGAHSRPLTLADLQREFPGLEFWRGEQTGRLYARLPGIPRRHKADVQADNPHDLRTQVIQLRAALMTQTTATTHRLTFGPADDSQCLLLRGVLWDAFYLHLDAMDACPACIATGGTGCNDCWDIHRVPANRYLKLSMALDDFVVCDLHPEGTFYPLTDHDRDTLAAALPEAITYRQHRTSAEDLALLAAYRELAARSAR